MNRPPVGLTCKSCPIARFRAGADACPVLGPRGVTVQQGTPVACTATQVEAFAVVVGAWAQVIREEQKA